MIARIIVHSPLPGYIAYIVYIPGEDVRSFQFMTEAQAYCFQRGWKWVIE